MFTDSFYPTVDGAVVSMETVSEGLESRGHEVVVLAPSTPQKVDYKRKVHYLPALDFKSYPGYRVVLSPGDMLEFLRKEKVDVIHCHGIASMGILSLTAARALKIPHVLTFHTMANEAIKYYSPIPFREDIIIELVWAYLRNLLKRPEVVIVPSPPVKVELEEHQVAMKSCEVVPTGVDCKRFTPENYSKDFLDRYGLRGSKVLLHVGRLSREKQMDVVLEAIANLASDEPDIRLLVVGKGPAEAMYKAKAAELGILDRVVFAGFLPNEELPMAYASSHALVIASTFETQGLVILEALASGTPVVGMRYRAIPEFVKEGKNGCLFEAENCAEAIKRCLARGDSMMMSAVSSAREFSIESCTAKLEAAYEHAARILSEST
jgi:1,2-diacylglycerol 3-alpha-glucosyltransferase